MSSGASGSLLSFGFSAFLTTAGWLRDVFSDWSVPPELSPLSVAMGGDSFSDSSDVLVVGEILVGTGSPPEVALPAKKSTTLGVIRTDNSYFASSSKVETCGQTCFTS